MPRLIRLLQNDLLLICLLLLIGGVLRFWQLDTMPPGMTHDEASIGFFVRQIAENTGFEIEVPYGYANEPFTKYSATPWFWLFGANDWTLRAHQSAWGLLGIVFAWLWGRAAFNRRVGLGTAGLMAVSYWPLTTSRMALNSNPTPALVAAAGYFLFAALDLRQPDDERAGDSRTAPHLALIPLYWLGFALSLGLSLNTYEAARATALIFPVFLVWLAIRRAVSWSRLSAFALALALGLGIGALHLSNPAAWGRTSTLAGPLSEVRSGNFVPLLTNISEGLQTVFIEGDPFVVYNLPGRPNLDPLLGALFVGGLLWCLRYWKQPRAIYVLLWIGSGLAPTLAIGAFTAVLHSIAAQVVVFALPMIAIDYLLERFDARWMWAGVAGWVALMGISATHDYFNVWGRSPAMRAAYFANFGDVTRYIDQQAPAGPLLVSSPFPDLPHDPLTYDLRVQRDDIVPQWCDAREALLFPNREQVTLILPVNAYADPLFAPYLELDRATVHDADDAIDPWFAVLEDWQPQQALAQLQSAPGFVTLPAESFGGVAALAGYQAHITGENLILLTLWRVEDPDTLGERYITEYDHRANVFVHLLDAEGNIAAQQDRLHAPLSSWQTGDYVAQLHRLSVPPGTYTPRIGLYAYYEPVEGQPVITNLRTPEGAEFILLEPVIVGQE